jgi:uncharacterized protein with FMN-binding domain
VEETPNNKKRLVAAIGLIVIVAAASVVAAVGRKNEVAVSSPKPKASASSSPSSSASPGANGQVASDTTSGYKDGTYTATGTYQSPGGTERITFSVTLKDGKITDTSATPGSTNPTGQNFQSEFASGYKAQVVGKSIDDVNVSHVSGSSLTSQGFNDAITQIKSQAKA